MGYISKYIPNTLIAIHMVAMATRKTHYARFYGNGQSSASLTHLFEFVGPKFICMSHVVETCQKTPK